MTHIGRCSAFMKSNERSFQCSKLVGETSGAHRRVEPLVLPKHRHACTAHLLVHSCQASLIAESSTQGFVGVLYFVLCLCQLLQSGTGSTVV